MHYSLKHFQMIKLGTSWIDRKRDGKSKNLFQNFAFEANNTFSLMFFLLLLNDLSLFDIMLPLAKEFLLVTFHHDRSW